MMKKRPVDIVREVWAEREKRRRSDGDPFAADFVALDGSGGAAEVEEGEVIEVPLVRPPWMPRNRTAYAGLDAELADFCAWVGPSAREREAREETIGRLELLVAQTFMNSESVSVHNFGSYHMGLSLPGSDLDFVLMGASERVPNPLRKLSQSIRNKRYASSINVIEHARVPIVKYTDVKTGVLCDVSFDMPGGVFMGKVFANLLRETAFGHARKLVVLVKYWLRARNLHEPRSGGMGAYSVLVLVVSHLQHNQRSGDTLASLFVSFFEFYGTQFNWATTGISLINGGSYFRKDDRNDEFEMAEGWKPALEDPCDVTNNISLATFNLVDITDAMAATAAQLRAPYPGGFGVLPSVFPGPHADRM